MTLHILPIRDEPATPDLAAEIFERIGRAWLRMHLDAFRAEGVELTVKVLEKSVHESSSSLNHG